MGGDGTDAGRGEAAGAGDLGGVVPGIDERNGELAKVTDISGDQSQIVNEGGCREKRICKVIYVYLAELRALHGNRNVYRQYASAIVRQNIMVKPG